MTPPKNQQMRFAYLDGAVIAARAIGEWALRSGFGADNVRVVDDGGKNNPVTQERVQQAVNELFPDGADAVEHLILAFCGHGLTDANVGSISWLFSDSIDKGYRVVADKFTAELVLNGVRRITLISDACRELPKELDLARLDAVRGIVGRGTQFESPMFDRYVTSQDGQLGFMVSEPNSANPGKCIFSGVVIDVLWGAEPAAITEGKITTATFGVCVRSRTTERAKAYGLKLFPDTRVDPEAAILYDAAKPPQPKPDLQPWPPAGSAATMGANALESAAAGDADRNLELVHSDANFRTRILGADFGLNRPDLTTAGMSIRIPDESKDLLHEIVRLRTSSSDDDARIGSLVNRLEGDAVADARERAADEVRDSLAQITPWAISDQLNLIVSSKGARVWSRDAVAQGEPAAARTAFHVETDPKGTPVLVELADGSFTPVVPYWQLLAVVEQSTAGDILQAYGQRYSRQTFQDAIAAISDFAAGRIGADGVDRLASQLRYGKHNDPVLGAMCAYLYRAVADFDSIRRMAYFYAEYDQPVPFDIALLGAMSVTRDAEGALLLHVPAVKARAQGGGNLPEFVTKATPETQVWIGGRCPWLGLGWDYVGQPRPEWAVLVDGLADHAQTVRRSGFTVLPKESGSALAQSWNLTQR